MTRLVPHLLAAVLVLALPGVAAAQQGDAATNGGSRAALVTEQQRLRGELDRTNAEIDALKQSPRGMRDDYRLRQRMADAEALARRLTDLEARLGSQQAAPAITAPAPQPAPEDGPAELDAKADILADQSRRLLAQADAMASRARQLQGRQELRQRSAQMDRDPLSPFDGSKRRVVSGLAPSATTAASSPRSGTQDSWVGKGNAPATPATSGTTVSTPPPTSPILSTSLTVQFRDLLDPAAMADIRRLEAGRGPGWETQALQRAADAMRVRAEQLSARSRALRARAGTRR